MREVVPITEEEFSHARTFSRVVKDFISWCGDGDYTFVTWGNMDLNELQRNMDYYRIPNTFEKPLLYFDLQKMYSLRYDDGKVKKSLGDAVQELGSVAGVQHNGLRPSKRGEAFSDLIGEFERGCVFFVRA